MKKIVLLMYILSFATIWSCNNQKKENKGFNTICIDFGKSSILNFEEYFSKIEIIPLETNVNSLINSCEKLILNENKESYLIFDYKQSGIFSFDKIGNFEFYSLNKIGNGPEEYPLCYDFVHNTMDSTYNFLNPMGIIYVYDENMNFIKQLKINKSDGFTAIHFFMPISPDIYALYNFTNEKENLYFYSISKDKIIKTISLPKVIDSVKLNSCPFSKINDAIFFNPVSISNIIYQINVETLSLFPTIIDYGNKTLTEEIAKGYNTIEKVSIFFEENKYAFPIKI